LSLAVYHFRVNNGNVVGDLVTLNDYSESGNECRGSVCDYGRRKWVQFLTHGVTPDAGAQEGYG